MTQWYLRYKSKNENLSRFIKALEKSNLLEFMELHDRYGKNRRRINFEDLPPINEINHIDLGLYVYSFVYGSEVKGVQPNTRCTTISIIGADEGLDKEILEIIRIAGETLKPYEFIVVCEEEGPTPIYKGKWDFKIFKKEILPQIEFRKKEANKK